MKKLSMRILSLALTLAIYVLLSIFNWAPIEEDAYIYFRCAENIAAGWGYVFNPMDERVEACSSITWLLLLAFFKILGFDVIHTTKIAGIVIGCLCLWMIYKISSRIIDIKSLHIFPSFFTALSLPFIMRNQMGLETPLYTFIFLCLVYVLLDQRFSLSCFVILLFMFALSRPEAMLIAFGMILIFYWYKKDRRETIKAFFTFVLLLVLIEVFRLIYFHDLLPNSFYHKMYPGKYHYGLLYTFNFFREFHMYLLFIPTFFSALKKNVMDNRSYFLLYIIILNCIGIILAGACYFPFYRHFVPVIPLVYILSFSLSIKIITKMNFQPYRSAVIAVFFIYALFALLYPEANWSIWKKERNFVMQNVRSFFKEPSSYIELLKTKIFDPRYEHTNTLDLQTLAGLFIRDNYLPGTTFVYDQMGRLPYNAGSDYYFIDSNGLTNKITGRAIFCIKNKRNKIFNTYKKIAQFIIITFYSNELFYCSGKDAADWIAEKQPDVILYCTLMRGIVIDELNKQRFIKKNYELAYYIPGILFLEKRGIIKKPFMNKHNLPVSYGDDIVKELKENEWVRGFLY